MKSRYLDIMARVVDVYDDKRFDSFINKTRENGIVEHGFPRLCANIGILMAHGRAMHLRHRFEEMMPICMRDLPTFIDKKHKRANDFSVREIMACISELESARLYPDETIAFWKQRMSLIEPKRFYRMVAPEPPVAVDNWAAFNAASEMARCHAGIANTYDFIENQIASQMFPFDENGMYRDPNDPMVYDIVGRNMLSACLYYGYNGIHKNQLEQHLRKAGLLSLYMQSVTGELPYGGRSNQFLHNEAHIAVFTEFEASAYKQAGDIQTASQFKAAAKLALDCIEHWLDTAPGQHVKNYFPPDSFIGCEDYAYYDKYMVTIASFLYLAYQFCDDTISPGTCPATKDECYTWQTSAAFRKLFCKAGSYFIELETRSDHHYDAEGIGRIHRRGAPSTICLSVPVSKTPNYGTPTDNDAPLSICCGKQIDGQWNFAYENSVYEITDHHADACSAYAQLLCTLPNGETIRQSLQVSEDGINICLAGKGALALRLPAFVFDGKAHTSVTHEKSTVTIFYRGWKCCYTASDTIVDTGMTASNRNGTYRIYQAEGSDTLTINIKILPCS